MAINYTNFTDANDLYEISLFANQHTGGMMGLSIYISSCIIVFMALNRYDSKIAFLGTMFFAAITGVLLRTIAWIPDLAMYIALIGFAFSLGYVWVTDRA